MPSIHAMHASINRNRDALLALPGVTAVAIGNKSVAGRTGRILSLVVFVEAKGRFEPAHRLPAEIDGIPTDVVERTFAFRHATTDPFERFDPLIGGISLTALEDPMVYGSIGCFINTDGHRPPTPAGIYLLTNQHVVQVCAAAGGDRRATQPGNVANPPAANVVGLYITGQIDATHDCAIVSIGRRGFHNDVPNHPYHFGNRSMAGTAGAVVGDRVYKFGATTKHTIGNVTLLNFNAGAIQNAIYIRGENNGLWCAGGDSGSVAIRYSDDMVLGLNFMADTAAPVAGGFSAGLAYDIATQMAVFGGIVRLA